METLKLFSEHGMGGHGKYESTCILPYQEAHLDIFQRNFLDPLSNF